MLAEQIDFVVGVDAHKHSHTAAIVTPVGGVATSLTVTASGVGYDALVAFARERAPGRRIWAIEGTGSFGAGLTARLLEQHELNRAGDRQLNRALHTVVISRLRRDPETQAYAARRTAEGKSAREIKRCLKRHLARHLFKLLEHAADTGLLSMPRAA